MSGGFGGGGFGSGPWGGSFSVLSVINTYDLLSAAIVVDNAVDLTFSEPILQDAAALDPANYVFNDDIVATGVVFVAPAVARVSYDQVINFVTNLYPVPEDILLGETPAARFTGKIPISIISDDPFDMVFFSPSLFDDKYVTNIVTVDTSIVAISGAVLDNNTASFERGGNEIDIAELEVKTQADDRYIRSQEESSRLFRFGPNSLARTNDIEYKTQPAKWNAIATLVQTIPPGPTTIIKIY